jgi:hypothetical protein
MRYTDANNILVLGGEVLLELVDASKREVEHLEQRLPNFSIDLNPSTRVDDAVKGWDLLKIHAGKIELNAANIG